MIKTSNFQGNVFFDQVDDLFWITRQTDMDTGTVNKIWTFMEMGWLEAKVLEIFFFFFFLEEL